MRSVSQPGPGCAPSLHPGERPTHRLRLAACIHPETYKYFLDAEQLDAIWARLTLSYGPAVPNPAIPIVQIDSRRLLLRAPECGSPVTVIRKRGCSVDDVRQLHELLGFEDSPSDDES